MVIEWRAPDLGMSLSSDADLLLYDNEFTTTALSLRAPELVFEPESVLAQVVTQDGIALSDLSVYWNGGWSNGTLEVVGPALVQNASADPSDVLVEFTMTSISPD